jgi:hypothetical protein
MTNEDFQLLRFNSKLSSIVDDTIWYYDCNPNNGTIKIFKELVDTPPDEQRFRGRSYFRRWGREEPWRREGALTVPIEMFKESFELVHGIVKVSTTFVKINKDIVEPYSITKPNFHMFDDGLPF